MLWGHVSHTEILHVHSGVVCGAADHLARCFTSLSSQQWPGRRVRMRTSHLVSTSTLSKVQCVSGSGQGRAQHALQHQDDVHLTPDPVFGNGESRKRFVSYHSCH